MEYRKESEDKYEDFKKPTLSKGVKSKEKSIVRTVFDAVITDNLNGFKKKLSQEILPNAINDCLYKLLTDTTNAVFKRSVPRDDRKTPYRQIYSSSSSSSRSEIRRRASESVYDYLDVEFEEYSDAIQVRNAMIEWCSKYNSISVARYYEFVDLVGNSSDENWGWFDLDKVNAKVVELRRGCYVIKLPKPVPIN